MSEDVSGPAVSSTRLLDCPFCGGSASIGWDHLDRPLVECDECGAKTKACNSNEAAIALWNLRKSNTTGQRSAALEDHNAQA